MDKKIIMGVMNLSNKTFYSESQVQNTNEAGKRAEKMVENGAQIIDIGAMSTGPNVEPISEEKERGLLLPVLKEVNERIDRPISIDTQRPDIAKTALQKGADVVNDISGLKSDEEMVNVLSEFDCSIILMANRISGRLRTAEKERRDIEDMDKVIDALRESIDICKQNGISLDRIAIDPGIGFGRDAEEDVEILAGLDELNELGFPICLGVSRKSFIGKSLGVENPSDRLPGSLAATGVALMNCSTDIVRTHDPKETSQFVRMMELIKSYEGDK